ncbi:MAG: sulfotransferase [Myxococcota bacterium]
MLRPMYLNRRTLKQVARSAAKHVSPRRALTWAGFGSAWVSLRTLNRVARRLDDVLYPAWQTQPVRQPVFIFANGRSGTTMLHRLLALDEDHFARYKLYQSMFSAVSTQRLIQALDGAPVVGKLGRRGVELINQTFFSGWEGIHELGINKEEEDEATFVLAMESPTISLLNPFTEDYARMGWLDHASSDQQRDFMDYYEAVVKKHLFAYGPGKHFLTKNVFTTPRLKTILARFPDARFVYLVRDPCRALPSWLNMFFEKWVTHSPELEHQSPQVRELAEMCFAYYRYMLDVRAEIPKENLTFVLYDDLVREPVQVVERLYGWLDFEMTEAYRARLAEFGAKQRRYKSTHRYSLAQFGLSEEWVRAQIPEVFATFGEDFPGFGQPNT